MIATKCQNCGATDKPLQQWTIYLAAGMKEMCFCSIECAKQSGHILREQDADRWLFQWIAQTYRSSRVERLPDQEASKLVLEFEPEDPYFGLYAYGPTGAGKTRSLVLRLKQFVTDGDDCVYIRGKQFGDEVVERTRPNGKGGFNQWFEALKEADVLALDEVDKMSFTDRVRAEFFELVECRTSANYPTLFVAQCSVDRLSEKMGKKAKEEAAGIIRRIKENCLPIHFETQKPQ